MGSAVRSTQGKHTLAGLLPRLDQFVQRHIGPSELEVARMVEIIDRKSVV